MTSGYSPWVNLNAHHWVLLNARRQRASACLYNPAMTPPYWQQAVAHLSKTDTVMAQLIASYPHASLVSRGDPFLTLVRSVVGQQISVRAADAIWSRLQETVPGISPTTILAHPAETLRQCGLSARKVEYLSDLARHFGNGQIHTHRWPTMSDAEIIKELTAVRGIGIWTAEMFRRLRARIMLPRQLKRQKKSAWARLQLL